MRTEPLCRTITAVDIQIRPADGTQALAVYPAKRLHGKRQQNLFAKNVADGQLGSRKKRGSHVLFSQFDIVILIEHLFIALPEEKIERARYSTLRGLKAARTAPLHRARQLTR